MSKCIIRWKINISFRSQISFFSVFLIVMSSSSVAQAKNHGASLLFHSLYLSYPVNNYMWPFFLFTSYPSFNHALSQHPPLIATDLF